MYIMCECECECECEHQWSENVRVIGERSRNVKFEMINHESGAAARTRTPRGVPKCCPILLTVGKVSSRVQVAACIKYR